MKIFIQNLITSNKEVFNIKLIINIMLHITILFTILSMLFIYFISSKSSNIINTEIKHLIDNQFAKIPNTKSYISTKINNLYAKYKELVELYNSNTLVQSELNIVKNKMTDINLQINNLYFVNNISSNESVSQFDFNSITQFFNSFSFDYYLDLFSENHQTNKLSNNLLFDQIKIVNVLIIVFFILFTGTIYGIGAITLSDIGYLFLENIITFIFVGLIEILFFLNVALKFVPTPPSLIVTSFINSLNELL